MKTFLVVVVLIAVAVLVRFLVMRQRNKKLRDSRVTRNLASNNPMNYAKSTGKGIAPSRTSSSTRRESGSESYTDTSTAFLAAGAYDSYNDNSHHGSSHSSDHSGYSDSGSYSGGSDSGGSSDSGGGSDGGGGGGGD